MKEYAFIVVVIAAIITLVAVAAGAIVYLRFKHGASSLKFQLSRIGIVWAALIGVLLLGGLHVITVTGWTVGGIKEAFALALAWARVNRMMASILVWSGSVLVLLLLDYFKVCTLSLTIIVSTLHVWASYGIWGEPTWPVIKALFFAGFIFYLADEGCFDKLAKRQPAKSTADDESAADQAPDTGRKTAPEVLGDMIAECADALTGGGDNKS